MTAVEDIKARVDVVDLIGETVRLRRSGKNYTGFCPFHANVHTPSFAVFPESGTWRCFGACNEGGDIFRFVMKKEGCDFPEALRLLAARAGIELHPRTPEDVRAEEEHARLRTLLELAATFFRSTLLNSPEGAKVLEYLHRRGLSDGALESFGVGLAPAGWENGIGFFRAKGYADPELVESGLAVESDSGGLRDRFRHRITIPIRDAAGKLCGFGARIVDPKDQPKFLNSPQTALFDKGRLLYGLDRAARAIRAASEAVIVEGYMDVMAAHQAGFENVISPMGTALTEAQLRMLKRYSKRIVLALDPDSAGDAATLRGLELAREALDREGEAVFDARGLVRYESRLQADVRVASLPDGKDPDEIVLESPEVWRALIADAPPVVLHVLHTLTKDQNLNDPKIKAMIAARMQPLIEDVGNKVERDAYRQQVARTLRVDERSLAGSSGAQPRRRSRRTQAEPEAPKADRPRGAIPESSDLGLLAQARDLLFRIDRFFGEMKLDRIGAEDFTDPANAAIFELVRQSLLEDDPEEFLELHLHAGLAEVMREAKESFLKYHGREAPTFQEALEVALRLRQKTLARQLADLQFYLADIQNNPLPETEKAEENKEDWQKALSKSSQLHAMQLSIETYLRDGGQKS
ncbi:MAG: DNA primase [Anaerolineales bacterium]|nr:DNA primase [Anaerolineales bacterium]